MKRKILLILITVLILTPVVTSASVSADEYYEYGEFYSNENNYEEKYTIYEWLQGPHVDVVNDNEVERNPFNQYTYPSTGSSDIGGDVPVYNLFSGGLFYKEGLSDEEKKETETTENTGDSEEPESSNPQPEQDNPDSEKPDSGDSNTQPESENSDNSSGRSEEEVIDEVEATDVHKLDDNVFKDRPQAVYRWNLYNSIEYTSFNRRINSDFTLPSDKKNNQGLVDVNFPSAGSIETISDGGKQIEIPKDPFVNKFGVTTYNITNSNYLHEYRKSGSIYSKNSRYVGSKGVVLTLTGAVDDEIEGYFKEETERYYSYVAWNYKLENPSVKLKKVSGESDISCLTDDGCKVNYDHPANGSYNGISRIGYKIPNNYVEEGKFKFEITGKISGTVTRYKYKRVLRGYECIRWKNKDSDNPTCEKEVPDYDWVLDGEPVNFEINPNHEISTETDKFRLYDDFKYTTISDMDTTDSGDDVKVHRAKLPNNVYRYRIEPNIGEDRRPWRSIKFRADSQLYSGWHYFSSRDKAWDRMFDVESRTKEIEEEFVWQSDKDGIYTSRVRPVNLHTFQYKKPHTFQSRGSAGLNITDYKKIRYKNKYQPVLEYHESCWIDYPSNPENIDPSIEERKQCNWTHLAKGVQYTEKDTDKKFYTGEKRKDAYTPHKRVKYVTVETEDLYNGVYLRGFLRGVNRYETVDTVTEVGEINVETTEISDPDKANVDICESGTLNNCIRNPESNSHVIYKIKLKDAETEEKLTVGEDPISSLVAKDAIPSSASPQDTDSDIADSTAIVGSNGNHYITINTGTMSKTQKDQVKIKINTVHWSDTESDTTSYLKSEITVSPTQGTERSLLRFVFVMLIVLWIIVESTNRVFRILGLDEGKGVGSILTDMLIPSGKFRLIMILSAVLLVLDYVYGGYF